MRAGRPRSQGSPDTRSNSTITRFQFLDRCLDHRWIDRMHVKALPCRADHRNGEPPAHVLAKFVEAVHDLVAPVHTSFGNYRRIECKTKSLQDPENPICDWVRQPTASPRIN